MSGSLIVVSQLTKKRHNLADFILGIENSKEL